MRTVIAALAVLLLAAPAWAWTETFSWDADPNATSYKIEKSVDSGVTWTVVIDTLTSPKHTYTGLDTETGLVLFRASNCSADGCTLRAWSGFWHNEEWQPPTTPQNVSVQ